MSDIKSRLTNGVAGLAATFIVSSGLTANAQAQQDNSIDTAKEAVQLLYPATKEVSLAAKSGDTQRQQAAANNMIQAQRNITALFGDGYDGNFSYNYQYKSDGRYQQNKPHESRLINAPVDCDRAFISVQPYKANQDIERDSGNVIKQGRTYLQLTMQPTMSMIGPFHLALNGIKPDPNPDTEKKVMQASNQSFYPIGHPTTRNPATHIFQMSASDFADFDGNERELGSHHKIPYAVAEDMMEHSCSGRLDELNEDLLDRFAKPPSGP